MAKLHMPAVLSDEDLWLVMLTKERAGATVEDCVLCGGLVGGIMFPHLASISRETLIEAVDEHEHYKFVDVEVCRVKAHVENAADCVRVVPDDDREFCASRAGFYRIAVYNDLVMLLSVDVGALTVGSTLSTLTVDGRLQQADGWHQS